MKPEGFAVHMTCPRCGVKVALPARMILKGKHDVIVSLQRADADAHWKECNTAKQVSETPEVEPAPSSGRLAGRIHQMLDQRAYVATGGSRACTMCGVNGKDCLTVLSEKGKQTACCAACHNGNTHTAPGESAGTCAQWWEQQVEKQRGE